MPDVVEAADIVVINTEDISMLFGEEGMAKVVSLDTGSVSTMSYKLSAMVGVVTRRLESGEVMTDDALT